MMPGYRCMDSHPYQVNPVPNCAFYYPVYESSPPHLSTDARRTPMAWESWPCGGSFGCPTLHQPPYHVCYNYGGCPGLNSLRPYHPQQVTHLPCCGNYAAFHPCQHVPPHYVPPLHYPGDHPRCEYDKGVPGDHHFYGCPNHPCNQKSDRSVRIEEQESEVEKEHPGVVPVQSKNYPYPIIWIPHENTRNKEHRKPVESEVDDQKRAAAPTKANEKAKTFATEPQVRNGWFPLDMDSFKSLMQDGQYGKQAQDRQYEDTQNGKLPLDLDELRSFLQNQGGEKPQSQQEENKSSDFPFPIFWIPSYGNSQEDERKRETDATQRHGDEISPRLKIIPMNSGIGDGVVKPEAEEGNADGAGHQKTDPTKQTKEEDPVKKAENIAKKGATCGKETAEQKPAEANKQRQSSSSPKASKLPPVCLRVDPLPKKVNGNGRSRSPSSSHKGQSSEAPQDNPKALASSSSGEMNSRKKEARTIPVMHEVKGEEAGKQRTGPETCLETVNAEGKGVEHGSKSVEEAAAVENTAAKEATKANDADVSDKIDENKRKPLKKKLSDVEAATVIQSAYRGYEVRRWETLKKLKQMAMIREQVADVKNQIQALEASSDHQKDEKWILVIGETIMSLLLKLDTVQGLHPSIRDIRKSLARRLMSLQEELDSLKKSKEMVEASVTKPTDDNGNGSVGDGSTKEKSVEERSSECSKMEVNQRQHSDVSDGMSESHVEGSVHLLPAAEQPHKEGGLKVSEQPAVPKGEESEVAEALLSIDTQGSDSVKTTETGEDAGISDSDVSRPLISETTERAPSEAVCAACSPSAKEEETDQEKVVEDTCHNPIEEAILITDVNENEHVEAMEELLHDVVGDEQTAPDLDCAEKDEGQEDEIKDIDVEGDTSTKLTSTAETDDSLPTRKGVELSEPPIGVIDEDQIDALPVVNDIPTESSPPGSERGDWAMVDSVEAGNENEIYMQQRQTEKSNEKETGRSQVEGVAEESSVQIEHPRDGDDGMMCDGVEPALGSSAGDSVTIDSELHCEEIKEVDRTGFAVEKQEPLEKQPCENPECVFGEGKMVHLPNGSENAMVENEGNEPSETPESPTDSRVSVDELVERDKKLIEENQRMKEMMEKLMEAGKEQLDVISNLTGRIKELEKKLSKKKKQRMTRHRKAMTATPSCGNQLKNLAKEKVAGLAM